MRLIVDASVVIKWAVAEEGHAEARALLDAGHLLLMPDLALIEVGNALWKKVARGEIGVQPAAGAVSAVRRVVSAILPSQDFVSRA